MPQLKKRTIRSLGLIVVIGFITRMAGLFTRPIWYDEAFSLLISQKGPAAVLQATLSKVSATASADIHPPTYYFLLWGWIQLFGSSIAAARTLSILISLGTILLVFLLGRELFDENSALLAALGAALLPFQVHYAVEMRMYELLAFWLSLATLAWWKGYRTGRFKWWLVFAVSAALGQYTHNLAAFYLLPLALTGIFLRDWKVVRSTFLAGMGAILLYLPWLIQIPAQLSKIQQNYWVDRPTFASLFNLLLIYLPNLPLPGLWLLPGLLAAVFLVCLAGFQTYLAVKQKTSHYKIGLWLFYLAFAPPGLLWLFSQWRPVYIERALLPAHVMFCIWVAWALLNTSMPGLVRGFAIVLLVFGVAVGLFEQVTYAGFPYGPFEALDQALSQRIQPGDIIVHANKLTYLPALYFNPSLPQVFIIDEPGSKSDSLAPATRSVLGLREAADAGAVAGGAQRIWFVIFQKEIDDDISSTGSGPASLQYLEDTQRFVSKEAWGEVLLYQFAR